MKRPGSQRFLRRITNTVTGTGAGSRPNPRRDLKQYRKWLPWTVLAVAGLFACSVFFTSFTGHQVNSTFLKIGSGLDSQNAGVVAADMPTAAAAAMPAQQQFNNYSASGSDSSKPESQIATQPNPSSDQA